MSDCEAFESMLESFVSGAVDEAALGPQLRHCADCASCRRLFELHRDLVALAQETVEPTENELDELQLRVLRRTLGAARTSPPRRAWGVFARVAAAAALFAAGLWAAPLLRGRSVPQAELGATSRLVQAITAEAASNRDLSDVENSRFTYSNVAFHREGAGRVALDFDVTTHVSLVESVDSELVREVLVQSLLHDSSTGGRLKALSYAAGAMEPKVVEALIFALGNDASLAVRLEALRRLSDQVADPAVQTALLAALRDDEAVQVRLQALECLAGQRVDRERMREVIREREQSGDEALLVRLAEYEKSSL